MAQATAALKLSEVIITYIPSIGKCIHNASVKPYLVLVQSIMSPINRTALEAE